MQKKIIALAVAGLVSGAAFAQSNVTIYGIMDVGVYGFSGNNESATGVQSNGLSTSRIGFKGEEALGNGLKAIFNLESGIDPDTKASWGSNRQANVGLSGSFGTVLLGIQPSLSDNWHGGVSEPMGNISSRNIMPGVVGGFSNEKADGVAYYSPMFSGMQFKAGYSSNIGGADKDDLDSGGQNNTRAYTTALSYANGPFKAGIAYAYYDAAVGDDYTGDDDNSSDWNAGVSYTFGQSTVSLFGAQQKKGAANIAQNVFLSESIYDKNTFWALGFNTYITPNDQIKVGYGQSKLEGVGAIDDETLTAWNLNYFHSLSKRSTLYAMYGNRDIEDIAAVKSAAKQSIDDKYQQMFMVGMRHTF